jgi:hypothetical protein
MEMILVASGSGAVEDDAEADVFAAQLDATTARAITPDATHSVGMNEAGSLVERTMSLKVDEVPDSVYLRPMDLG